MSAKPKIIVLLALLALALARPAFSFGIGHLSAGFGSLGAQGSSGPVVPPPPLTNLRITNNGSFRVTAAGANRAVSP